MITPHSSGVEKQTETATAAGGGGGTGPEGTSARAGRRGPARLRTALLFLAAGGFVALMLGGYFYYLLAMGGLDKELPKADARREGRGLQPLAVMRTMSRTAIVPALRLPRTWSAKEAGIADDAEVIGVSAAGRARAYLVAAMGETTPTRHVLNDVVGGRAVSVTYCKVTRRSRTFAEEGAAGRPLEIAGGGWVEGKGLVLRIGNFDYLHETGENLTAPEGAPFPYPELTHVRTTWKAWRETHPGTDIYVGDAPEAAPSGRTPAAPAKQK